VLWVLVQECTQVLFVQNGPDLFRCLFAPICQLRTTASGSGGGVCISIQAALGTFDTAVTTHTMTLMDNIAVAGMYAPMKALESRLRALD
jgi:hypothetical protein